jgi:hypothetical protein
MFSYLYYSLKKSFFTIVNNYVTVLIFNTQWYKVKTVRLKIKDKIKFTVILINLL